MDSLFKFCSGYCVVKVYLIYMYEWDTSIINLTVDRIYEVIPNFFIAVSLILSVYVNWYAVHENLNQEKVIKWPIYHFVVFN